MVAVACAGRLCVKISGMEPILKFWNLHTLCLWMGGGSMRFFAAACLAFGVMGAGQAVSQTDNPETADVKLTRVYVPGELIAYKMLGVNESPQRTRRYEAHASGVVRRDDSGKFIEELGWSNLHVNDEAVALSAASEQFKETLSLDPSYKLSVPGLSKVQPILIGPITDLLTFYADVQLAMRQSGLSHAGDHVYVKHGVPNSWADGTYTLLGQDSIDFDITLVSVDPASHGARLVVRHVPPAQPQIKLPAPWMVDPVGSSQNNWVQVQKVADGGYAAAVGQESFEADIKLSLPAGRIVSATLDNPVDVVERACDDAALTVCAAPTRYRIRRQITVEAEANPTGGK